MRGNAFILAYGIALSSCGGGNEVSSGAKDLAEAVCDLSFRCCTRGEISYLLGPYVFQDDCAERLVTVGEVAPFVLLDFSAFAEEGMPSTIGLPNLTVLDRAVRAGRTVVNGDQLDECLAYLSGLTCGMIEEEIPVEGCVPDVPPPPNPCALTRLFEGKGEEGDECASPGLPIECKYGLTCAKLDAAALEGTCVELGDEGDPCFGTLDPTDGSYSYECRRLREEDRDIQLYCSQLDGTCRRPSLDGETCLYADREEIGPSGSLLIRCDRGLSCDALSDTCVAQCQRGAACGSDDDCDEEAMLTCILGRCDLLREETQPCGGDDDCVQGLRCEPNPMEPEIRVCTQKIADGQPCPPFTGSSDCASGWCNSETGVCAPQKSPGSTCPDGDNAQCANGYCEQTFIVCDDPTDCPGSGVCNTTLSRCEFYCIAYLQDGSPCDLGTQCLSTSCVRGYCRTLPLPDGAECDFGTQCDSSFCSSETPPVCATPPLADGRGCSSPLQCASQICYELVCNPGLPEGQPCNDAALPPCARDLYCDTSLMPAECVKRLDAGEVCEGDFQCRGDCVSAWGRQVCDETAPLGKVVCDGEPN